MPEHLKPYFLESCKDFKACRKGMNGCRGCNVWNYLYDIEALKEWCKEQGKDFTLFTMEMHKRLLSEREI